MFKTHQKIGTADLGNIEISYKHLSSTYSYSCSYSCSYSWKSLLRLSKRFVFYFQITYYGKVKEAISYSSSFAELQLKLFGDIGLLSKCFQIWRRERFNFNFDADPNSAATLWCSKK